MAILGFQQEVCASDSCPREWAEESAENAELGSQGKTRFWMFLDAVTVLGSAILATIYKMHLSFASGAIKFWDGTLFHGRSMGVLLILLSGFTVTLIVISQRSGLYSPIKLASLLHEQRLSVQACLTSGLLLTGTLYLLHAEDISRTIVLVTIGLVTVLLSLRRLLYRFLLYRRFRHGVGTRNVLIVGTGPEAVALRYHLDNLRHLGYTFKGFIEAPGLKRAEDANSRREETSAEVVGTLETLFQSARKRFVDEIFFTMPCDSRLLRETIQQARTHGVDLRIVPDMYDGLTWNSSIEYVGQFPTIPLYRGQVPETALLFKRVFDIVFSSLLLTALLPFFVVIAIAIILDSRGPAFYASERIGKKGHVFRCIKFRTMIRDADKKRAELLSKNERDGVLFKISDDPRITRLGRFLRKYSLDELPQFFNVLRGDMSIVGPRPPIGSEVRKYKLNHLRRLDVTPGITGLWQVQARQDPSFDSYISLDVAYIENWSIWLDIKIILRTIGVVFAGTGS